MIRSHISLCVVYTCYFVFCFNDTATTEIYTLSLHDALPICRSLPNLTWRSRCSPVCARASCTRCRVSTTPPMRRSRSEEHTSELQSRRDLVCRLLLEKKKK